MKTVMNLTWDRHFERNGGLNQILKRQTSPFHYCSKFPAEPYVIKQLLHLNLINMRFYGKEYNNIEHMCSNCSVFLNIDLYRHDIIEVLLKVALNTIDQTFL